MDQTQDGGDAGLGLIGRLDDAEKRTIDDRRRAAGLSDDQGPLL